MILKKNHKRKKNVIKNWKFKNKKKKLLYSLLKIVKSNALHKAVNFHFKVEKDYTL